jgi:uncharacterized protein
VVIFLVYAPLARAAEVIPPTPTRYFNDYANVVSRTVADQLNQKLEQFERDTSNQILVVIYPKMQSESSIEDYTVRVAEAWKVGQKLKNNGAVLFVFVQNHKLYIQVGYGLEGALPDALCKRIIDSEITPSFKQGDFSGGLTAGVNAMMAATKGEYKGTGHTVHDQQQQNGNVIAGVVVTVALLILLFSFIASIAKAHAYTVYTSRGRNSGFWWAFLYALFANSGSSQGGYYHSGRSSGDWSGGGGWSGGGSFGGFSSGGGSFGGGGAGGSW